MLNDEKAMLSIGDRVPIASGSFTGIVGAAECNTQFQYLDVGVNIDITPHIQRPRSNTENVIGDILCHREGNIGGISQPIIGQRRIEHETRLADGEVNLLGGILEQSETQSLSGYPWISRVPLLKYLFGQDNGQRTEYRLCDHPAYRALARCKRRQLANDRGGHGQRDRTAEEGAGCDDFHRPGDAAGGRVRFRRARRVTSGHGVTGGPGNETCRAVSAPLDHGPGGK